VITSLDVLSVLMELRILRKLDGSSVVTQHLDRIINSRSEIEILKETAKAHYLLRSNATCHILCLLSGQNDAVLLLAAPLYGSIKGEDIS